MVTVSAAGINVVPVAKSGDSDGTISNYIAGAEELASGISVYPNPVTDFIFLNNDQEIERIDAVDGMGRPIPQLWKSGNTIDFREYPTGIYTLKVKSKRSTQTIRIVKK